MRKFTRISLLLLAVLLLFPWKMDAAALDSMETQDDALLTGRLERMAEDYVTKYVNTAYLYETEDFTTNTLLAVSDEDLSRAGITQLTTDGTAASTADLKANLQQFADVAGYYKHIWSAKGYIRNNLTVSFDQWNTHISGDSATVEFYARVSFRYSDFTEPTSRGGRYTVYFTRLDTAWYITDIYSDELYFNGLTRNVFNCAEAIREFDARQAQTEQTVLAEKSHAAQPVSDVTAPHSPAAASPRFRPQTTINRLLRLLS